MTIRATFAERGRVALIVPRCTKLPASSRRWIAFGVCGANTDRLIAHLIGAALLERHSVAEKSPRRGAAQLAGIDDRAGIQVAGRVRLSAVGCSWRSTCPGYGRGTQRHAN